MSTLKSEIAANGHEAAIAVCRDRAPEIASEVSREKELRIGRTSYRLRNPGNAPPPWARDLVRRRVEEPRYLLGPGGTLAALLPIRLQEACLACHGPAESIPEGVREALAASYPEDRATGFEAGELRGWFWIEVP
jgi:hypothetical protein